MVSNSKESILRDEEYDFLFRNYFYEICGSLSNVLNVKKVCDIILEMIVKIVSVERASLMLYNKRTKRLEIFASKGIPKDIVRRVKLRSGEGISGKVFESGKPMLVGDIEKIPEYKLKKESKFETRSFLSVPLIYSGGEGKKEIMGVVNATDKTSGVNFTLNDQRLITALSAIASMAVQNSRLYENIKKGYKELKRKNRIIINTQKSLMANERLSSVGTLAASVVHEIKNPMAVMSGAIQILMRKGEDEKLLIEYSKIIKKQIDNIVKLTNQLLSFSKEMKPERKSEDLNNIVKNTLIFTEHYLSRFKGVKVIKNLKKSLPQIYIDSGQIQQVFVNIISNAAQAMPSGGTLKIETGLYSPGSDNEKEVFVSFVDNGNGIEKKYLKKIFHPFFTTKNRGEGTGLGLSISRDIIKRHKGRIEVKSKFGEGTSFLIFFPIGIDE